jgi:hypothetical protein
VSTVRCASQANFTQPLVLSAGRTPFYSNRSISRAGQGRIIPFLSACIQRIAEQYRMHAEGVLRVFGGGLSRRPSSPSLAWRSAAVRPIRAIFLNFTRPDAIGGMGLGPIRPQRTRGVRWRNGAFG